MSARESEVCTCAMTEFSQANCAVHGYDESRPPDSGVVGTVAAAADFLASGADPGTILSGLRYGPDQQIVNPFDEHVWLAAYSAPGIGRGITDCCFVAEPCPYHAALAEGASPVPWVPRLEMVRHWPGVHARFDFGGAS